MNKGLSVSLLLIGVLFLTALKSVAQDYYYTACDSFKIDESFKIVELDEHEVQHSYAERTYIYCSPDSTQEPLGFVNFNTSLTTLEIVSHVKRDSFVMYSNRPNEYRYTYHIFNWKKINFRNGFGYVKETDLADEYYPEGPLLLKKKNNHYQNGVELKAIAQDPKRRRSLDKITVPCMHGFRLHVLPQNGLENSGTLIHYETFRESCPGATSTTLISLNKSGLTKIISSSSGGEAGMFNSESIYYPLKIAKDSVQSFPMEYIMLYENDKGNFDLSEIAPFNVPKNIGVPLERLLIKTRSYTENILDENGNELMDEHGMYRVNVINEEPVFYEWNGIELRELGSNYYVQQIDSLVDLTHNISPTDSALVQVNTTSKLNDIIHDNGPTSQNWKLLLYGLIGFLIGGLVVFIFFVLKPR